MAFYQGEMSPAAYGFSVVHRVTRPKQPKWHEKAPGSCADAVALMKVTYFWNQSSSSGLVASVTVSSQSLQKREVTHSLLVLTNY